MGQLEIRFDFLHGAGNQAQAPISTHFGAGIQQHLHPQANAQQRLFPRLLQNRLIHAGFPQCRHAHGECAHTGQDHTVRRLQFLGTGHNGIGIAQVIQRLCDAFQIARAVINHRYHANAPFVDVT